MADDKFIMFGLDDEKSKYLAEILANKTCKKIIDYLSEINEASEKDISNALSMPINTVEYNLNKLIKAGLVEKTKNFFWSIKGKKIPMYKLAKKHIVISPKSKKPSLDLLKTIIPAILIVAFLGVILIGLFFTNFNFNAKKENFSDSIKQFSSYEELISFLNSTKANSNIYGMKRDINSGSLTFENSPEPALLKSSDSAGTGSSESSTKFSKTNIQVEGVDEPDIIKNDGKYIYAVNGNRILIIDAYPTSNMKIISEMNISSPKNIFVNKDILVVFSDSSNYYPLKEMSAVMCIRGRCPSYNFEQRINVFIYNINDKSNPKLKTNFSFEGNYIDSRMIGDFVYLISNKNVLSLHF